MSDTVEIMIVLLLGNPGLRYENTKHNASWIISNEWDFEWLKNKYGESEEAREDSLIFVKPLTYMNESGRSASWYKKEYDLSPEDFIVVYDDVDLPIGTIRVSFNRGSGGHNGIKSIEQHLGGANFIRVRIGVANVDIEGKLERPNIRHDFVLSSFSSSQRDILKNLAPKIKNILEVICRDGYEAAMSEFN